MCFHKCKHYWVYAGNGLGMALVPLWIFRCKNCGKTKRDIEGFFPDEESFVRYRQKMGEAFKASWCYVVEEHLFGSFTVSRTAPRQEEA